MKKKYLPIAAAGLTFALVLAGCGSKPAAAPAESPSASPVQAAEGASAAPAESVAPSPVVSAAPAASATAAPTASPSDVQSQKIDVYYTDPDLMDLVPAKAEISFTDEAGAKYREAFRALQSSGSPDLVPLWDKIKLNSLKFANGLLTLDVHKPQEAQLGAGGEAFAIDALTKTMFQFSEVKNLEVLVDGEQAESLMGHVDLLYPFTRGDSAASQQ